MTRDASPDPSVPPVPPPEQRAGDRLQLARARAGFTTATEAARAFGWNENTYRSHENSERGIKRAVAEKYARAFNVTPAFILIDEKYDDSFSGGLGDVTIPISGKIGEEGEASLISRSAKVAQIEYFAVASMAFYGRIIAMEVQANDVLGFLSDGDLVIANNHTWSEDLPQGTLCLIGSDEQRCFLRFLQIDQTKPNVNIETSVRRPPRLISPDWIVAVHAIIPRGQWRKESREVWAGFGIERDDD